MNDTCLHLRRTKIVATVGPASQSPAKLAKLMRAGVNVFRVNFSHGDPRAHTRLMRRIRAVAQREGHTVAILADLCGPKIRVGTFPGGSVVLRTGSTVRITARAVTGSGTLIPSQYPGIVREAKRGERVLLDDGALELRLTGRVGGDLTAKVVRGGVLKDKKGMNLPDTKLQVAALTAKDRSDLPHIVRGGADYIALSFVRRAADIGALRRALARLRAAIPIIAKIEKPEAVADITAITAAADGLMVARGDLGVELPAARVPLIQEELISVADDFDKPVIVATQMLESMIQNATPTRAEVSDVANACRAGADAVMLSGETAVGKYPLAAVRTMDSVLRTVEAHQYRTRSFARPQRTREQGVKPAVAAAVALLSRKLQARCLAVITRTGATARIVAAGRPAAPLIAVTPSAAVQRRLVLLWGVVPVVARGTCTLQEGIRCSGALARRLHLGRRGEPFIVVAGLTPQSPFPDAIVIQSLP